MADNAESADSEDAGRTVEGAGAELKRARESRSLSIEEVSTDLRIEPHLLNALEREDWATIGAPVFAKGYIRQYASRLGLDPAPLVERYLDAIGHVEVRVEPSRTIKLHDAQQSTIWVLALLGLALIAVFLLVWWYREPLTGAVSRTSAVPDTEPAAVPFPEPEVSGPSVRLRSGSSEEPSDVAPGERMPRPAADDPAPTQAATDVDVSSDPESTEATVPVPAGDEATLVAAAAADPAPDAAGDAVGAAEAAPVEGAPPVQADSAGSAAPVALEGPELELVFAEDCWVEITDAEDRQVLFGLVTAGSRRVVSGTPPFDVFLGNADAAAIRVDGLDFTVPRAARRGNLARFAIPAPSD